MKKLKSALVAIPAYALATGQAFAQSTGVDVTEVVAEITGAKTSVGTIGVTVLGVIVALAVFVWIRRAIK